MIPDIFKNASTMDQFQQDMRSLGKNFLIFAIVFLIGAGLAKLLLMLLKKVITKLKIDHAAKTFIYSCLRVFISFIVVLVALNAGGVNVNSIVTALIAAVFTAGLALQNTLSNLFSGVIMLIHKPFSAGDLIEFEGYEGYVDSMKMFFTTIRTYENKLVRIPNSKLTSNNVVNCTAGEYRRVSLNFTVSYEDNITKVKSVIYDVISQSDLILQEPEPKVYVGAHLDSGVGITVFVWVDQADYFPVYFYMQENVKKAFDENGITIPYPHMVVKK